MTTLEEKKIVSSFPKSMAQNTQWSYKLKLKRLSYQKTKIKEGSFFLIYNKPCQACGRCRRREEPSRWWPRRRRRRARRAIRRRPVRRAGGWAGSSPAKSHRHAAGETRARCSCRRGQPPTRRRRKSSAQKRSPWYVLYHPPAPIRQLSGQWRRGVGEEVVVVVCESVWVWVYG